MYLMNYNFMADSNILDPVGSKIAIVSGLQLSNAIFDHLNVLNSGTYEYSQEKPEEWTNITIMDADFNGNINAGNISYSTENLAGVRIKRRIKGTFAWLTLYDFTVTSSEELSFTKYDLLNKSNVTYEYAIVPYLDDGTESNYIVKEVDSYLNGVFVMSPTEIVKFYGGLSYGTANRSNRTGVFEPLGSKYPVVVANAETNYYKGSLTATALSYEGLMNNDFNRSSNTEYLRQVVDFMTDKTTKIIKDWNGNIWLATIVEDVNSAYNNNVGMGIADVNFNFVEIGSAIDQDHLEANGFINIGFRPGHSPLPG